MKPERLVYLLYLGRMRFSAAEIVQNKYKQRHLDFIHNQSKLHHGNNTLILVEHDPVYTVGIRTKNYTHEDEVKLKETGAEFVKTNRGGLITFHGPGQLVAYPILNLKDFTPSMKWYICALEKAMIQTCHMFGLKAKATEDTGVWIEDRKIGAIGVHGSRYVTTHGISLNCNIDLQWYDHIVPCGIEGKGVTSLSQELKTNIRIQDVTAAFLKSFQTQFSCDISYDNLNQSDLKILKESEEFLERFGQKL